MPKRSAFDKPLGTPPPPGHHPGLDTGGTLRAAVFGVNDGLVSNASLILGVAGATSDPKTIIIAGIAGLMAGAFSMAAGEYISVKSQRELFEGQIELERIELKRNPKGEMEELAQTYHKRGIPIAEARKMAKALMKDPEHALEIHAREEMGVNPEELGSPWAAAIGSFLAFVGGAIIPLVPFFFLSGMKGLWLAIILSAIGLFTVGSMLTYFTKKNPLISGLRMLLIGSLAGAVTFLIGHFIGASIS